MKYASNLQWNNLNATRRYPLVDGATSVDDDGKVLPDNILADLSIQTNGSLGSKVFIGSICVSPKLISMVLMLKDGSTYTAVATLVAKTPIDVNKNYKFTPVDTTFAHQTDGWVTFGNGANTAKANNYKFSSPTQTQIIPGLAVVYPMASMGVTDIKKIGRDKGLSGVVRLVSLLKNELVVEHIPASDQNAVSVDNVPVDAIIFRLNTAAGGKTLLSKFLGPCDHSPESGTCNKPPIYGINGAVPDCSGVINIEFEEDESPLWPIFTVSSTLSNGTIKLASAVEQSTICGLTGLKFTYYCPDNCSPVVAHGPFESYNPRYE